MPIVDLAYPQLESSPTEWRHLNRRELPQNSPDGLAPMDRVYERLNDVPIGEEVEAADDLNKKFIAQRQGWLWHRPDRNHLCRSHN